ncbi:MAG TPA: SHOCT domain-containing protein, partial [Nitrospirales bacterium]
KPLPSPALAPAGARKELSVPPAPNELSLEERLLVLKKLRDQGLITDEEYRQKKKQLLDRF